MTVIQEPAEAKKPSRKQVKDARKKILADLLVQGTNDSSIVSKRSVEKLYSSIVDGPDVPHFFQHFVKKPQRRSPAINRGYWIRMNAIKNCIDKIIDTEKCGTNVVVNLGCGYDPLPFQIIDHKRSKFLKKVDKEMDFLCIDIDYPELISLKVEMIKNSPELMDIVGEVEEDCKIEGVAFKTKNYAAVGCNLRDLPLFQSQLTKLGLHELNTTSIFIAEVSLAYMLPEHADAIIKETSTFPKSHFVILEQLLPTDEYRHPFGRTMLHHFKRLNTPLQCVPEYRTIESQKKRFTDLGFPEVEARDLLGCWKDLIDESEKSRVRSVEFFDEYEEFIFYTQHYIVLHATNSISCCFTQENKSAKRLPKDYSLRVSYESGRELELDSAGRKFSAAAVNDKDEIILVAGSSQNRLNTSLIISKEKTVSFPIAKHQLPPRMCHTLTTVGDRNTEYILIGGRNAPHKPLNDCWRLESKDGQYHWTQLADLPLPRSRHAAVALNDSEILVFGGAPPSQGASAFCIFNHQLNAWKDVEVEGANIENMKSAAITYDITTGRGYICGGLNADTKQISDTLFEFSYLAGKVKLSTVLNDELLERYGSKIIQLSSSKLLIVGGVSENFALNQENTIITIDLRENKEITSVYLNDELWHNGSMFVGFDMVRLSDGSVVCLAGGAVCFGFGSFWNNKILRIRESDTAITSGKHDWHVTEETETES